MSYIPSNSKGPTYEYPIVEKNAERSLRPVTIKYRKVLGKRGWLLRRVGTWFGAPDTAEGKAHAALMVGEYLHELHTDEANQKYLVAQRLTHDQVWPSTVGETIRGYTSMSDQEIADTAMRVQSWMRSRKDGKYHVKKNNCHHFVNELLDRITAGTKLFSGTELLIDDDKSTRSSTWTGSTTTLEVDSAVNEKPFAIKVQVAETVPTPLSEKPNVFNL